MSTIERNFNSHRIGWSRDSKDSGTPFFSNRARRRNPPNLDQPERLRVERLRRRFDQQRDPPAIQSDARTEAIVITDMTGQIISINAAGLTAFFNAPEQLSGKTCGALLLEGLDCPHQAVSREHSVVDRVVLSRSRDRLLNFNVRSFEGAGGNVCGYVHTISDVTSELSLQDNLIECERISRAELLVSSLAHEVATPMSVIANIAEMLLLDSERESPTAGELSKIVTQVHRVSEMTRRMLDFLRPGPALFTDVDVAELTFETLDLIKLELRRGLIKFSVENNLDTPLVRGERAQLQQVLLNLLSNAVHAMKDGGGLIVRIADDACDSNPRRTVVLTVEDTGPGISPPNLERIFDFFFTTRATTGGTGLGLAISRKIIEQHGGTIRAENIENSGARLLVTLPAATAVEAAHA